MKKKLVALLTLCMLCLFCTVGFAACSCGGGGNNGTYYLYYDGNYNKTDYISLSGSTWTDDGGYSGTCEIKDGKITLYVTVFGKKEGLYEGTIKDGVMLLKKYREDAYYCKEGCKPSDNSGKTNTNTTPQHTHKFVETVISPTCVQQGYTIYKCSICGYEKTGNYIDVSDNHNYVNNICTVCGKELPPTDGSYFKFTLLTDDTYEIRVKNKNNLPSNIIIAPSYYGTKVTRINDSAFENCSNLRSITIPDSITSIGEKAFYKCSGLTSITIPDGVTSIEQGVFAGCSSLTSINIPYGVTSIGEYAFYDCSSLSSVIIPDSVTSIGYWAFDGCGNLEYNEYDNGLYLGNASNPYLALIETKSGDIAACVIHQKTKIISEAFASCNNLKNITIPNSVISIGYWAFQYCSNLTSVTIPDSVISIGECAFQYCSSLTSITIPDSVTSIGDGAFQYCSSLTSITIPDSVTSIGDGAFAYCSSLTSVTIGNSVANIGERAFAYCGNLETINFNNTIDKWQLINKAELWNGYYTSDYYLDRWGNRKWYDVPHFIPATVVHCTDGDVDI